MNVFLVKPCRMRAVCADAAVRVARCESEASSLAAAVGIGRREPSSSRAGEEAKALSPSQSFRLILGIVILPTVAEEMGTATAAFPRGCCWLPVGVTTVSPAPGLATLQEPPPEVRNGHIKRITDNDIQSLVLEIEGTNVSTTYITCPADPKKTLGIKLPFLVMIIKNLKKYFTFEVQVLDDKNVRRRFRASNYQSTTRVKPFICTMPMRLDDGWNQIQFNLSDFTRRAYGTNYIETLRVQIHANCRIRRVYFSDRLYSEDELPAEFKLYLPVQNKAKQ
ncbi:PREDICTED: cilia- and flagella-associated protein 20 [Tinamus guttatus]|uniref:cilia- and flagella-associated protein 20 n=1 Tax=Tinamus guttatus TaxID=94827 RepID=UPI00052F097A|nr:PREDICTED: cilia- and flagella-associated protein 20 [Tinamus guttatus]